MVNFLIWIGGVLVRTAVNVAFEWLCRFLWQACRQRRS